jgi:uncharacterized membrane protein YeaQ/YmgE (transglycosylase-associated protein family)
MGIIFWIIIGLVAGLVAQWLMPGKTPGGGGIIVTIILGIIGGLVGGFLGRELLGEGVDGFNLHSFALAIGGAVLLLFVYGLLKSKGKI